MDARRDLETGRVLLVLGDTGARRAEARRDPGGGPWLLAAPWEDRLHMAHCAGERLSRPFDVHPRTFEPMPIDPESPAEHEAQALLAAIVEGSDDAIVGASLDGVIRSWNKGAERMLGYSAQEIRGKHVSMLVPPERLEELRGVVETVAAGGRVERFVSERVARDRRRILVSTTVSPIRALTGEIIGISNICRDITRALRAEEALRESEERFRTIFDQVAIGVARASLDRVLLDVNPGLASMFGYAQEELIGHSIAEVTHPDDRSSTAEMLESLLAGERKTATLDKRYRHKEGHFVWARVSVSLARKSDGTPDAFVVVVQDITARKKAEEALQASEDRFRVALDGSPITVFTCDRDLRYTWIYNPRFGMATDQMIGRRDDELMPAGSAAALVAFKREALQSGRRARQELELDLGSGPMFIDVTAEPLWDGWGAVVGLTVAVMDVTVLEQARAGLLEAHRRKDEFLAVLAHELRNPLAPIRHALELLRGGGPEDPTKQRYRDVIERQVDHLAKLVDDLLDVARITRGVLKLEREPVALDRFLDAAIESNRPAIDAREQQLELSMPGSIMVRVDGDVHRLTQIVENLLSNAAKYTPPGGKIWLSAAPEADALVIRVRDSGMGIHRDKLETIFEPFHRVDQRIGRREGGLGIGLSLVRRLVELHGGTVRAHSEGPGHGTEFVVRLPAAATPHIDPPSARADAGPSVSPLRILVVDDNEDAALMLQLLLETHGHHVEVSHDGVSALARAETFEPQLVLLDLGLPGMDGYEVAGRLRRRSPDGPPERSRFVLAALTGYGQAEDRKRTAAAGFDYHLVKPVEHEELDRVLAAAAQLD